jgi:hypothetical protein
MLELFEKDSEREDLLFLKCLLPVIKSFPSWQRHCLRLEMHQIVTQKTECIEMHLSSEPINSAPPPEMLPQSKNIYIS